MLEHDKLVIENQLLKEENRKLRKENEELQNLINKVGLSNLIDDGEWDDDIILFLVRSERRVQILKSLSKNAKNPQMLNKEIKGLNYPTNQYVKDLKDRGLIVCLNEWDTIYRFYGITPKGRRYLEFIEELDPFRD